jgi:hypothetical protein
LTFEVVVPLTLELTVEVVLAGLLMTRLELELPEPANAPELDDDLATPVVVAV